MHNTNKYINFNFCENTQNIQPSSLLSLLFINKSYFIENIRDGQLSRMTGFSPGKSPNHRFDAF
jgi:hypothetical protein